MQNLEKLLLEFILERKKKNEDLTLKMIPFDFKNSWASSPFLSSPSAHFNRTWLQEEHKRPNSTVSRQFAWQQMVLEASSYRSNKMAFATAFSGQDQTYLNHAIISL